MHTLYPAGAGDIVMGGLQIGNLLNLMEANSSFNADKARREVLEYLNGHMDDVAAELKEKGEAVIQTSSGSFRLTKDDLVAA
jgi:hypothetical protein